MSEDESRTAIHAEAIPLRDRASNYPEPLASRMAGREKRQLGAYFGLEHFGVNLTRLEPGAISALRHAYSEQDELVYIPEGGPTLVTDAGRTPLEPGMCAGFRANSGDGHQLVNETGELVVYLELGDRSSGDRVSYPDDDSGSRGVGASPARTARRTDGGLQRPVQGPLQAAMALGGSQDSPPIGGLAGGMGADPAVANRWSSPVAT